MNSCLIQNQNIRFRIFRAILKDVRLSKIVVSHALVYPLAPSIEFLKSGGGECLLERRSEEALEIQTVGFENCVRSLRIKDYSTFKK
jgi:hypothetical protein